MHCTLIIDSMSNTTYYIHKAKCRPFMFCFEKEGKLWFCTNNTKDVYQDMQANPEIESSGKCINDSWDDVMAVSFDTYFVVKATKKVIGIRH